MLRNAKIKSDLKANPFEGLGCTMLANVNLIIETKRERSKMNVTKRMF